MFVRIGILAIGALGGVSFSPSSSAQAGPPLLTDDPATPGDGHWEINLAWTHEHTADGYADELPLADINVGIGERVQLKLEVPWSVVGQERLRATGFGNALAGVKWRFFDAGDGGWQLSTYPQAEFVPPGLHSNPTATGGVSYLIPIEVQRTFGGLELGAEVGRWLRPGREGDGWIAGLAAGHAVDEQLELLAELHDEIDTDAGGHELVLNLGARRRLSDHFTLLASFGADVSNTRGPRQTFVSYLALQITL